MQRHTNLYRLAYWWSRDKFRDEANIFTFGFRVFLGVIITPLLIVWAVIVILVIEFLAFLFGHFVPLDYDKRLETRPIKFLTHGRFTFWPTNLIFAGMFLYSFCSAYVFSYSYLLSLMWGVVTIVYLVLNVLYFDPSGKSFVIKFEES